jgi:hypothetical protein
MVLLAGGVGSHCVPHTHPVVGVSQIVHEGWRHRGGGAAVWLCSPMLTISKSLSLSSPFASCSAGQPSHLTSQLCCHQALAAALLTVVAGTTPACWSQLPTTITAHRQPMPGLMATAHSQ